MFHPALLREWEISRRLTDLKNPNDWKLGAPQVVKAQGGDVTKAWSDQAGKSPEGKCFSKDIVVNMMNDVFEK